jgi:hypothetical protein
MTQLLDIGDYGVDPVFSVHLLAQYGSNQCSSVSHSSLFLHSAGNSKILTYLRVLANYLVVLIVDKLD